MENAFKNFKGASDIMLLEVLDENGTRRVVISNSEWLKIKEWYCGPSDPENYMLVLNYPAKPDTVIRFNRSITEIKARQLTLFLVLFKDALYILLSSLPAGIGFFTALLISAGIYTVYGTYKLFEYSYLEFEMIAPAVKISCAVFIAFWLFNLCFALIKLANVLLNRYKGVILKPYKRLSSSLAFNAVLLTVFAFSTPEAIIGFIKDFLNFISRYI